MLHAGCRSLPPINLVISGTNWCQHADTDNNPCLSFNDGVNTQHVCIYKSWTSHFILTMHFPNNLGPRHCHSCVQIIFFVQLSHPYVFLYMLVTVMSLSLQFCYYTCLLSYICYMFMCIVRSSFTPRLVPM